MAMTEHDESWWKTATIYQIYPKSFCDSGSKGTGDIKGIISKLDYLKHLSVDAIWLTPVYASPMIDNGYDISDYYAINPQFGTMEDFDLLLAEAHQRGIRIVMDIVVNHTSTEHAWFQSALGDKNSPYRDYYIWKDPVDGQAPTNWQSKFGGNAWELDEATGQYFLHLFAKEQADLNWENPVVREEVKDVISFWAEKGVDGFRLDVINLISKQQDFPNDDIGDGRRFYTDGPRVHEYLKEISEAVFQKYGSVTVGEMSSTTLEHCQQYSNVDNSELSMVFNFHHLKVDYTNGEKWTNAPFDFLQLKSIFNHWQTGLNGKGWGALFWCNHDQPRVVSRLGNDQQYRVESAKMLAASVHMMQGTPYIYQGEEIGMTNPGYTEISQYRDVESTNMYDIMVNRDGVAHEDMMAILAQKSRDNSRTPMQWNSEPYAGFSQAQPWLDVANNYPGINAEQALEDKDSVFYFYKSLIELRKQVPVITDGSYQDLLPEHPSVFAYSRESEGQTLLCINNYYGEEAECVLPERFEMAKAKSLLSNYQVSESLVASHHQVLQPYETRILLIEG
ncbi:alpha,alpha-phosphotrehalase [Vibrio sp. 10N.222.51.C8]|uniref:alpha,alpha-phosphotrehalase n=1 Tax=unclassified Vibrio TaxID=2614977 RepID=UPI000C818EE3|nr:MULTISPECIES: alpha,alpha-phosphotrehalase [unclassified Vibrio]PMK28932.1 alpha,alpha-phosphotrehalase [Vibrio sp. 10N.261.54.C3]PMN97840.1 alpha,alpha-phosphotrehalase [Vibrio sp. 10N.222.55.F9]PMO00368.1 alpha,alpha-phosphotrehalase [Vibrio sp. 10N.222.55.C12]PMO17425.1 alpha,alpha-phosphotrehalase [Vibrio sp. 10N.222.54.F10]PMO25584.1 alpha,alpha-phosphotrehalase [Vibrio sp. 10N.222.54.B6]